VIASSDKGRVAPVGAALFLCQAQNFIVRSQQTEGGRFFKGMAHDDESVPFFIQQGPDTSRIGASMDCGMG
jgi:hypothetical protein